MKLTLAKLEKLGACQEGKNAFIAQKETDAIKVLKLLIDHNINWANWLVTKLMTKKQNIRYAIYAAEQVIEIYENRYPTDLRPRKAIQAAKAYLKNPTAENKNAAADAAANAAYAAADAAANAAYAAANAANAAYAAADAADAANAAYAADAAYAAYAANAAYAAADAGMKKKIILYGIQLLQGRRQ